MKTKNKIDKFKRYQSGLPMETLFPIRTDGLCACGCGRRLTGKKRRWATKDCTVKAVNYFKIVKGDGKTIRHALQLRDKGVCACCGVKTIDWDADHIVPVFKGGGGCDLDNFQTLCKQCHKAKTKAR